MPIFKPKCSFCGKTLNRTYRRMNENLKMNWKVYCSNRCLGLSKRNRKEYVCSREGCGKRFIRTLSQANNSRFLYCSCRCAVIVSNKLHPRNPGIVKICAYCSSKFKSREKYCSKRCKDLGAAIPEGKLLNQIKDFVKKNDRIPYKYEIHHYSASRGRFGTWNNAIIAAGFKPNPVLFAKKHIAKDGDKCDSLAEMIIDNYLSRRNIKHLRNFQYPGDGGYTVDFKIGDVWVEFFGLVGFRRYDLLKKRKLRLVKKLGINLIELYPKDLFPVGKLEKKLNFL